MSDGLNNFIKAKAEFDANEKHAETQFEKMRSQANLLQNWKMVGVVNSQFTFPAAITLRVNPRPSFDATDWPDGNRIAELLSRYHKTGRASRVAFDSLSEAEKQSVQCPHYLFLD